MQQQHEHEHEQENNEPSLKRLRVLEALHQHLQQEDEDNEEDDEQHMEAVQQVLDSECEEEEEDEQQQQQDATCVRCCVCGCVRLLAQAGLSRQPTRWRWSCWPCYSAWYDTNVTPAPHS